MPDLLPRRETRCLPEHLHDLKHTIHCEYGTIESVEDDGNWKVVKWIEGVDPNMPRVDDGRPKMVSDDDEV
jgi:hypothetical protein